jgi:Ca2+-binding EF-hand superfamily protein
LTACAGLVLLLAGMPAAAQEQFDEERFREALGAESFQIRDKNNNDVLTLEEFLLGARPDSALGRLRATYFKSADLDSDGLVSKREAELVSKGRAEAAAPEGVTTIRLSGQDKQNLREAFAPESFRLRDKNNDGQLTKEEFRLNARGENLIAFRDKLFGWADENHDGIVTQQEPGVVIGRGYVTPAIEPGAPDAPGAPAAAEDIGGPLSTAEPVTGLDIPLTRQVLQRRDTNNDGWISQSEFAGGVSGRNLERANAVFARMDRDSNGQLTAAELQWGMFDNGLVGAEAAPADDSEAARVWGEHVNRLYAGADKNNDGRLSLEELTAHYGEGRGDEARSLLYRRDANADGVLTRDEMQRR